MKKFLAVASLSCSISTFLSFACRFFPNYQLIIWVLRLIISLFLIMNYRESGKTRSEKNLFMSIGCSLFLGVFLGYWDELTWLIPLFQREIVLFISAVMMIIGGVWYAITSKKTDN
jgi:hypothetical protein